MTSDAARHLDAANPNGDALGGFADWPQLDACPACGYNLTGLTPGRPCPECGWGEGHLGVFLPAWSSRSATNRGWRNTTTIALLVAGLLFTCCIARTWWLIAGGILATILLPGWIARMLIAQPSHDTRVIPFPDGVLICAEGWPRIFRRWAACSRALLRSRDERFHEIVLMRRFDVPQPDLAEVIWFEGTIADATEVVRILNGFIHREVNDSARRSAATSR